MREMTLGNICSRRPSGVPRLLREVDCHSQCWRHRVSTPCDVGVHWRTAVRTTRSIVMPFWFRFSEKKKPSRNRVFRVEKVKTNRFLLVSPHTRPNTLRIVSAFTTEHIMHDRKHSRMRRLLKWFTLCLFALKSRVVVMFICSKL